MITFKTVNNCVHGFNKDESRLPYLDGLRAVAVLLVLIAHAQVSVGFPHILQRCAKLLPFDGGALGVDIFFVISGFIITHILLKEEQRHGRVSIVNFWKRRALRILPALVVYISIIVGLGLIYPQVSVSRIDVLMALTFSSGILAPDRSWWLGHTWSLSIEEQFYLGWPLVLWLMPRNRMRLFVVAGVIFPLASAVLYHWMGPSSHWLLPSKAGYLLAGCALAVCRRSNKPHACPGFTPWTIATFACLCVIVPGWLANRALLGVFTIPFGSLIAGLGLALLLNQLLNGEWPLIGHAFETPAMKLLGRASYSIYLWQQLFLCENGFFWVQQFPQNVLAALLAGGLSLCVVEKPFLKMKDRLSGTPSVQSARS